MLEVLLATWQGAHFLRDQLDSLLAQETEPFTIVVADDGSTDDTLAILAEYDRAHPGRFRFLPPADARLGPQANFSRLLEAARADYIFLCDQDDVWLPGKMDAKLRAIRELEREHGPTTPCLVHSDLTVVDRHGAVLGSSFFAYAGIRPHLDSLMSLIATNVATGCASVINRALRDRAVPVPANALMHDHWVAQVAAAIGVITHLEESTILYRQHGGNALGAQHASAATFFDNLREALVGSHSLSVMERYVASAGALAGRVGDRLDPRSRAMLVAFAGLKRQPAVLRLLTLARHRIYKRERFKATVRMYILVFRLQRNRTRGAGHDDRPDDRATATGGSAS